MAEEYPEDRPIERGLHAEEIERQPDAVSRDVRSRHPSALDGACADSSGCFKSPVINLVEDSTIRMRRSSTLSDSSPERFINAACVANKCSTVRRYVYTTPAAATASAPLQFIFIKKPAFE